jgi:hypothetical protein
LLDGSNKTNFDEYHSIKKLLQLYADVKHQKGQENADGNAASVGINYESLCNTPQRDRNATVIRKSKKKVAEVADA